jgi:hypothetical protein
MEFVSSAYFKPSHNTRVVVKVKQAEEEFPIQQCEDCVALLRDVQAAEAVTWTMVHASTYDLFLTDCHLHQLVTAVRNALRTGMSNGAMKRISQELVAVVL